MLVHDIRVRNTYSYAARYQIYDTTNSYVTQLETDEGETELQYASFGPTGNQIVSLFGKNYNMQR